MQPKFLDRIKKLIRSVWSEAGEHAILLFFVRSDPILDIVPSACPWEESLIKAVGDSLREVDYIWGYWLNIMECY